MILRQILEECEVGIQVTTMNTTIDIRKELENGCVNVNMASFQILENIFQLYIKPIETRYVKSYITIYI